MDINSETVAAIIVFFRFVNYVRQVWATIAIFQLVLFSSQAASSPCGSMTKPIVLSNSKLKGSKAASPLGEVEWCNDPVLYNRHCAWDRHYHWMPVVCDRQLSKKEPFLYS